MMRGWLCRFLGHRWITPTALIDVPETAFGFQPFCRRCLLFGPWSPSPLPASSSSSFRVLALPPDLTRQEWADFVASWAPPRGTAATAQPAHAAIPVDSLPQPDRPYEQVTGADEWSSYPRAVAAWRSVWSTHASATGRE